MLPVPFSRESISSPPLIMPSGTTVHSQSSVTGIQTGTSSVSVRLEEDIEELRATLGDAVREQMIADVPLGAFFSGGIDSTIIVGLMQQSVEPAGEDLCDRLSRPEVRRDPTMPRWLRHHLGTEHQTFIVEPKAWETLPALAWHFDEPFADSSALPTWYVCSRDKALGDGGLDWRCRR